jgi:hypothetical protein
MTLICGTYKPIVSKLFTVQSQKLFFFLEELHNLYSSPDIIRQVKANEVGGACGTHGRGEKSVQGFGGKAQRKETTWIGGCGLDSTGSGQGPVAGCCECGDEPSGSCATELVCLKYLKIFSKIADVNEICILL